MSLWSNTNKKKVQKLNTNKNLQNEKNANIKNSILIMRAWFFFTHTDISLRKKKTHLTHIITDQQ